jgi:YgiT-type zinc finger domain-containing protein
MPRGTITCTSCGKPGARIRRVIQSYGRGANASLVRNIPMISCRSCCEVYLTSKTLHELEWIKAHHRTLTVKRRIAIAEFPSRPRRGAG